MPFRLCLSLVVGDVVGINGAASGNLKEIRLTTKLPTKHASPDGLTGDEGWGNRFSNEAIPRSGPSGRIAERFSVEKVDVAACLIFEHSIDTYLPFQIGVAHKERDQIRNRFCYWTVLTEGL